VQFFSASEPFKTVQQNPLTAITHTGKGLSDTMGCDRQQQTFLGTGRSDAVTLITFVNAGYLDLFDHLSSFREDFSDDRAQRMTIWRQSRCCVVSKFYPTWLQAPPNQLNGPLSDW
jgi:hypothetical protein